ncbi:MAG: DUF2256 and DUF3253 domain-containing protein [Pseudomonadota bacterium]
MQADKVCARCGRVFSWRRKWASNWDRVRYCSDRCRRSKLSDIDRHIEATILNLLQSRAVGATICPSEAARAVFSPETWRDNMERTRQAGRRLAAQSQLVWTQGGRVVDPSAARGPVRFRLSAT